MYLRTRIRCNTTVYIMVTNPFLVYVNMSESELIERMKRYADCIQFRDCCNLQTHLVIRLKGRSIQKATRYNLAIVSYRKWYCRRYEYFMSSKLVICANENPKSRCKHLLGSWKLMKSPSGVRFMHTFVRGLTWWGEDSSCPREPRKSSDKSQMFP